MLLVGPQYNCSSEQQKWHEICFLIPIEDTSCPIFHVIDIFYHNKILNLKNMGLSMNPNIFRFLTKIDAATSRKPSGRGFKGGMEFLARRTNK